MGKTTKSSRTSITTKISSMVTLLSVLLMQFALAFYVCPNLGKVSTGKLATITADAAPAPLSSSLVSPFAAIAKNLISVDDSSMPDCQGMDQDQTALCHATAFDQQSKQSLDKPSLPDIQAFVAVGIVQALYSINSFSISFAPQNLHSLFTLPKLTPLTILHCCFRI